MPRRKIRASEEGSRARDDVQTIKGLKKRFDLLAKELNDIHDEWKNIHEGYPDTHYQLQRNQLIIREGDVLKRFRELLTSILSLGR